MEWFLVFIYLHSPGVTVTTHAERASFQECIETVEMWSVNDVTRIEPKSTKEYPRVVYFECKMLKKKDE